MEEKIQFQKDADVLNELGEKIGSLERVVLNPQTNVITSLVVRTGVLFGKQEKVVPIELVTAARDNSLILRTGAGALDILPPFEEKQLVSEGDVLDEPQTSEELPPVIYGYPGTSVVVPSADRFVTVFEKNIPDGTIAMKEGAKVLASEGKQVGQVESVLVDPDKDEVTHLCISSGLFVKDTKIIPIHWVKKVAENEVHLMVKKASVENLASVEAPE